MCEPTTIALGVGLALSAAGTVVDQQQQAKAVKAQQEQAQAATARSTAAAGEERERQRGLEEANFGKLSEALDATNDLASGKPQQEIKERLIEGSNAAAPALTVSALPGQVSGDTDLARLVGGEVNAATTKTKKQVEALATLNSLGGAFSGLQDQFGRTASGIQNINSARRGSLGASQLAINTRPGIVTPSAAPFGDLLQLGGQAVGSFGPGAFGGAQGLTANQSAANAVSGSGAPIFSPLPVAAPNRLPF